MQSRVVFMGTPEFAIPALKALASRIEKENLLVVTQPDRASGRGRHTQVPPVKQAAELLGLEVEQIATMRDSEIRARLEAFAPDLIVVAAFGLLLPKWVLRLPKRGCVNLHASILPRFRGASPIAAAIACGDDRAGVALMEMEVGLDTGGVYALADIDISDQSDTTASLTVRLAGVSAELLMENLDRLLAGELQPQPQRGRVIETRKLTKAHGEIAWHRSAAEIERHTRAMWPWPRAWTSCVGDARIQIHAAEVVPGTVGEAGIVVTHDDTGIVVGTGDGGLRLKTVQLAGKSARAASDLRQHPAFAIGARLGGNVTASEEPDAWIVDTEEIAGDSDA